jgi:DNA-binding transcriptional LysR family regulator
MELNQLRALVALSETTNFVRASDKLHLSPPAIFAQIRQLEEEVGAKIYERAGKSLVLNVTGQVLLRHAKQILAEHDLALVAVKETKDAKHGLLRLGCGPHTSIRVLPHLLHSFLDGCPLVEVENVVADYLPLLNELRQGHVDVVFMNSMMHDAEFESVPLWRHERVFVVSGSHPLARKKAVTADEIRDIKFILPCGISARDSYLRTFRTEMGFEPKVVMNSDQAAAIVELLKLGMGMSILPWWSVAEDVRAGQLAALRLKGQQFIEEMGLIYRKTNPLPAVVAAFVAVAKDWNSWLPISKYLSPVETEEPTRAQTG